MVGANRTRRLPAGRRGLLDHRPVGEGGERVVDHQGDLEGGLELGLVEAGEGPPGVGRLHLGGGDDVLDAVLVGEGGPVEAVQLVVEDAGEREVQGGRPRSSGCSAKVRVTRSSSASRAIGVGARA